MADTNWNEFIIQTDRRMAEIRAGVPEAAQGFAALARATIKFGVTRQEIMETIAVAVYMGGGPAMIYGAEALDTFDALSEISE